MTSLFISAVSEEFRTWREFLRQKLIVREVQVQTQEILIPSGLPTLFTLDDYIKNCDVVIHLVGKRTGREDGSSVPGGERVREFIEQRYPQLPQRLGVLEDYLATLTFTQWEAWLAVFHRKRLFLPVPVEDLQTDNSLTEGAVAEAQLASQEMHFAALEQKNLFRDQAHCFASKEELWALSLNFLANNLDEWRPAPTEPFKLPGFPPLDVLIASSRTNEKLGREIKESLNNYRDPEEADRKVFKARTLQDPESLKEAIEDYCTIIFLLEEADKRVCDLLGRALQVQKPDRNRHPRIIGTVAGEYRENPDGWKLPSNTAALHDFSDDLEFFHAGEGDDFCRRLHKIFTPEFTVIADQPSFEEHESDFRQAMQIYAELIPVENERDQPENIENWICNADGSRNNWKDYLVVARYPDGEVFGAFWCNIDLRTGLGHVPFWGMLEGYRSAHGVFFYPSSALMRVRETTLG